METWQVRHITENLPDLIKYTNINAMLLAKLLSSNVLSSGDIDILEALAFKGKFEQSKAFYDKLITLRDSYKYLIEALKCTMQSGAVQILEIGVFEEFLRNGSSLDDSILGFGYVTWKDLSQTSKKMILERVVLFNGKFKTLRECLDMFPRPLDEATMNEILDSDILISMARKKEALPFVKQTIPDTLSYYIPRTIIPRTKINCDIFKLQVPDVFVIKGISRKELTHLVYPEATGISSDQLDSINAQFIVLKADHHFEHICQLCSTPVHLITYDKGVLTWESSSENVQTIQGFTCKQQSQWTEEEFLNHILNSSKPICISDTPGMGKTVLMAQLASYVALRNKHRFPIFLRFGALVSQMRQEKGKLSKKSICCSIAKIVGSSTAGCQFVKYLLKEGSLQVDLYIDGFDELNIDDMQYGKSVIMKIMTKLPNFKLFLTTRPHMLADLEQLIHVLGFNIAPFEQRDQKQFLIKYWQGHLQIKEREVKKLECFAGDVLNSFATTMRANNIAGVPLQCRMIGDVFLSKISKYMDRALHLHPSTVTIFAVYKSLIDMRFARATEEQKKLEVNTHSFRKLIDYMVGRRKWKHRIVDYHVYIGLQALFPNNAEPFRDLLIGNSDHSVRSYLSQYGILSDIMSERPRFFHRTFAEYLIAEFISNMLLKHSVYSWRAYQKTRVELVEFLIRKVLVSSTDHENQFTSSYMSSSASLISHNFFYPAIAYFIEGQLNLRKSTEIDMSFIPNYLRVRHVSADNTIENCLSACISANCHNIFNFVVRLYPPKTAAVEGFLLLAAKRGSAHFVSNILTNFASNLDVSYKQLSDISPLHVAVQRGNYDVFERLFSKYFKFVKFKNTLLHVCVAYSVLDSENVIMDKIQIIDCLLLADSSLLDCCDENGYNVVLQPCIHESILRHLISINANVNILNNAHETPLHKLISSNATFDRENIGSFVNILSFIPETNFNLYNQKDLYLKETSLHKFVRCVGVDEKVLRLYKENGFILNSIDQNEENLVFAAVRGKQTLEEICILVRSGVHSNLLNKKRQSLLHICAEVGHPSAMIYFITVHKLNVDLQDVHQNTPLHIAMRHASSDHSIIITILLDNGASCNQLDLSGRSPIFVALQNEKVSIEFSLFRKLLRNGMIITPEIANRAVTELLTRHTAQSLLRDDCILVLIFLIKMGGELLLTENTSIWEIPGVYETSYAVFNELSLLGKKLPINKESFVKRIKSAPFMELFKEVLLCGESKNVKRFLNSVKTVIEPHRLFKTFHSAIYDFIYGSSENIFLTKSNFEEIFISKFHDVAGAEVPVIDSDKILHVNNFSRRLVIIEGYHTDITKFVNTTTSKVIAVIVSDSQRDLPELCRENVFEDKITWSDINSALQTKILNSSKVQGSKPNINNHYVGKNLVLKILLSSDQSFLFLTKYGFQKLKSTLAAEENEDLKLQATLVSLAIVSVFPSLKHITAKHWDIDGKQKSGLEKLVNSYIIVIKDGSYTFSCRSIACYIVAVAMKRWIPDIIEISNNLIKVINGSGKLQSPDKDNGGKSLLAKIQHFDKTIVNVLNTISAIDHVQLLHIGNLENLEGSEDLVFCLKYLLFAHAFPTFSCSMAYCSPEDWTKMAISYVSMASNRTNARPTYLDQMTIYMESINCGSFFLADNLTADKDTLTNIINIRKQVAKVLRNCVTNTVDDDIYLVANRIRFLSRFFEIMKPHKVLENVLQSVIAASSTIHELLLEFVESIQ